MSKVINAENFTTIRRLLKNRLENDYNQYQDYNEQYLHLKHMMKRTVDHGESNSALVIGPKGCGKTTLINKVINELLAEYDFSANSSLVYLSGIVHTNDRLALQSITIQLKLEESVEGRVFGSFADNLAYLLACLKTGDKQSKSVIFIIDEFDLFCSHHNQTLLYNLFDIAQSAQAPICVLGLTCRLDVVELLEKRVKSRFSHRQIFLWDNRDIDKIDKRINLFKSLLLLPTSENIPYQRWNKSIEKLIKIPNVKKNLEHIFDVDLSGRNLQNLLMITISKLSVEHPELTELDILDLVQKTYNDNKIFILLGLSVLEICLLISFKHHSEIYDGEPANFEMIFDRYKKFTNSNTSIQTVQREVVQKAFEHLVSLELIVPIGNPIKAHKEYHLHTMLVTSTEIMTAVKKYPTLPTEVLQWATSSLV